MSKKDREKTAFVTRDGLFEFKGILFGLCNAPATFRLIDLVLAGIHWSSCLVYIDDIMIMGRMFQQHLVNLKLVLCGAGLKLKPTKCSLCRKDVLFLGHRITREGIATDPAKTTVVLKWAVPHSTQELQTTQELQELHFLGLVGYYRKYVSDFAGIAKPKGVNLSGCRSVVNDELKARLMTALILAIPDFSRTFILNTDASDVGL